LPKNDERFRRDLDRSKGSERTTGHGTRSVIQMAGRSARIFMERVTGGFVCRVMMRREMSRI
jgi:hypothetical protein